MFTFSPKKIGHGDVAQHDNLEKNHVRGHALFVRFMERNGLSRYVSQFPDDMTLSKLKHVSGRDLINKYNIKSAKCRNEIQLAMSDIHREDQCSDVEVRALLYFTSSCSLL